MSRVYLEVAAACCEITWESLDDCKLKVSASARRQNVKAIAFSIEKRDIASEITIFQVDF